MVWGLDPLARLGLAVLVGMGVAPWVVMDPAWVLLSAIGAAVLALPRNGMGGVRGWVVGGLLGVWIEGTVPQGPALAGPVTLVGVRTGPSMGRSGDVAVNRWLSAVDAPASPAPGGRVRVRFDTLAPPAGVKVVVVGDAGPIRRALPGAPDPVRAARRAGVNTEIVAEHARALSLRPWTEIPSERDPTGLLRALLLGDRSGLPRTTVQTLRNTGTSHLISVSGFHVSVAAGLIVGAVGMMARAVALVRHRGVTIPAAPAGAVAAWLYAALSGWSVPAQRAAALWTLGAIAKLSGRRLSIVAALVWVAVGIATLEPGTLATPSFGLSFSALAGILLITPRLVASVPPDTWAPLLWLARSVGVTVGASVGTLPLAAFWFQELAPTSPIANLFAGPLLGTVVIPLAGAACLMPDPIGLWLSSCATGLCRFTVWGLEALAFTPLHPAVGPFGAVALGVAAALATRRPVLALVLGVAVLAMPQRPPAKFRVTFLDVGQGDAAVLAYPDGRVWLVDGGPPSNQLLHWLRRHGVRRLDGVVLTHGDRDHWGGLVPVLEELRVTALFATDLPDEIRNAAHAHGVPIRPPLGVLHPWPGIDPDLGNEGSVILAAGPVLLMGDLDAVGEAKVAERIGGQPLAILKAGHHGSRTATSETLLDKVAPKLAILSLGPHNRYGHPHREVLGRLEEHGVEVLRTDRDGTVTVTVHDDHLRVETAVGRRFRVPW